MNKFFKKTLAALIALVMIFTIAIPAFAAKDTYDNDTPVVLVPGIINKPILNSSGTAVLMPDFSKMGSEDYQSILTALKAILKLQDSHDYAGANKKIVALLHNMLDEAMCNPDGSSKENLHVQMKTDSFADSSIGNNETGNGIGKYIDKNNIYLFNYDWRMDTTEIVDTKLNPFIDMVKQKTGSDKVIIAAFSMGGAVTNTYLSRYGSKNDVKKAIFVSSAGKGVQVVNDILNRDIEVIREAIAPYFTAIADTGVAVGISAISNYATEILGSLLDSQLDAVWEEFLAPFFLNYASIWEFAKHDSSVEKAMDENNISPELRAKVERYYKIQDNIDDTLKDLESKGVEICFVSNYNRVGIPVTSKAMQTNTDFLIDTIHTSNGATVADLYKTLGDSYKQKKDDGHNHLSADSIIDASTCFTPEKTWFIKNLMHVDYTENGPQSKFLAWLIATDNATIESNSDYPQFLNYDKKDGTLSPVTKVEIEEAENENGGYISSAMTVYKYTKLTALGWAVIFLAAALIIILIAKKSGNKEKIEGVLTKKEIKALPKEERKPAKKNNKALKKQYKKDKKSEKKAHKAELKAMPKPERKAAKKADKLEKKANKKQRKADKKQAKKDKKTAKKTAKAEKKAAKVQAK